MLGCTLAFEERRSLRWSLWREMKVARLDAEHLPEKREGSGRRVVGAQGAVLWNSGIQEIGREPF